jgi:hypothetical protein
MRTYGEPIDVRTGPAGSGAAADGAEAAAAAGLVDADAAAQAPTQFLWRGRLYVVRAVLAHWVELGSWWTAATRPGGSARSARSSGSGRTAPDRADVDAWRGQRASAARLAAGVPEPGGACAVEEARRSVALDVGAIERAVWRVEARAGRSSLTGVYDLVRDIPAAAASAGGAAGPDRWRLARALD